MVQKMTTLMFRSEILHDEFLNAMHLFCCDVLLFSRKFPKIVRDGDHYKNGGHEWRKFEHKNFAREKCKSKIAFLQFAYLCAKFTPKPRILCLILNSRRVSQNQLYFMVKKSNFVAFFSRFIPTFCSKLLSS